MSNSIVVKDIVSRGYDKIDKEWTYEELLDLFDDDSNVVKPLVLRCIEYEDKIELMIQEIEALSEVIEELNRQLEYC